MPMNSHVSKERVIRNRSILALLLIVPISSIAALCSTTIAPGAIGQGIAVASGIWMVIFPVCWHVFIDRQNLRVRITRSDGLLAGIIIGILMFGLIFGSYWFVGRSWLDPIDIRARADRMGMNVPLMVYGFGTFQTLVNSLIEEYVWRWFVYRHCALLVTPNRSVWLSAGFFTLHHIILMFAYCPDWRLVAIGSIAVFAAGVIWARCMKMFNSLLPCYISHLAADLALQIASWHILLG
jgi:uncharacterized protein